MTAWLLAATKEQEGPLRWAALPPAWAIFTLSVLLVLGVAAVYRRERGRLPPVPRIVLVVLRSLAFAALLLVLAGPYRETSTVAEERAHLAVLVDTSASMAVADGWTGPAAEEVAALTRDLPDTPATPRRIDVVRGLLAGTENSLIRELGKRFVVDVFGFDDDWRSLGTTEPPLRGEGDGKDPTTVLEEAVRRVEATGSRTRIGAALRRALQELARRQDRDLAGIVLLTDGRDTSEGESILDPITELSGGNLRILPIGLGNPATGKNAWLERMRADDWVLVRDEVLFETGIRHEGFEGSGAQVDVLVERIADAGGQPVEPRQYDVRPGWERSLLHAIAALPGERDGTTPIRFRLPLDEVGTFRVRTKLRLVDAADRQADSLPDDDEQVHEIHVVDQRIKVLYVDNQPRHDWRFLSTYLTREPDTSRTTGRPEVRSRFQVHVLLQSADPSYPQPASPGERPLKVFPRTRSELFAYDVIIFGDVDWMRLDPSSREAGTALLERLVEFVAEGGGIVMQAGVDYRMPLELLDTPLAPLLPIHAAPQDRRASEVFQEEFRLRLTPAGIVDPIFGSVPGATGGVPTPEEIAATWAGETALSEEWTWWWLYRATGGLKPGATALARVAAEGRRELLDRRGEPLVVFATMPFGKGRVFWSSIDHTSRLRRGVRDLVFGPFWEQILRDMATYRLLGGNRRFKIFSDKDVYFVGETATVTIRALDPSFEPLREPWLDGVHVQRVGTSREERDTALVGDARPRSMVEEGSEGLYRVDLPLLQPGTMRISIDREETTGGRRTTERAERRFEVHFRAQEDVLRIPDHALLLEVAKASQPALAGEARVLAPWEAREALLAWPARPRERVLDRREVALWDRWPVLLVLVGLLALEWALRRRYQLV